MENGTLASTIFCFACGEPIDARAEIYPKCGVRQKSVRGQKSKIAAALLAFFLG
jgi:NMD protein affecting ribosome stability and mRNA decay